MRHLPLIRRSAVVLITAVVAGCATAPTVVETDFGPLPGGIVQFADAGPLDVDTVTGSFVSVHGCTVEYEIYRPVAAAAITETRPLVVLAHGFVRDRAQMRLWAETWASYGVETAVPSFCNSRLLAGNHDRNADDMVELANLLAMPSRPVIYGGFSAGGLAALLATAADDRAVAYLGLDPVDSGDLAKSVAQLRPAALYFYGEAGRCNAQNNMLSVMPPSPRRIAVRARYATHCDFEYPTDGRCERLCGDLMPEEAEEAVRRTIRAVAGTWILEHAGVLPPGSLSADLLAELESAGRIEALRSI